MNKRSILLVLLAAIVIAILAVFFASSLPDGLEKTLNNLYNKPK